MASLKQRLNRLNNKIRRFVQRFEAGAPATVQNQGFTELRFIRDAYNNSTVFLRESGKTFRIEGFEPEWGAVKAAMGWDMRRGWATNTGLGSAVGNPAVMRRTSDGFFYDLNVVNSRIKRYVDTFNREQASDSLMQFKEGVNARMRSVLKKQIQILVKEEFGDTATITDDGKDIKIELSLKKGTGRR